MRESVIIKIEVPLCRLACGIYRSAIFCETGLMRLPGIKFPGKAELVSGSFMITAGV